MASMPFIPAAVFRLRRPVAVVALLGFLLLAAPAAHCQTVLFWDTNGTTAGAGGTTPSGTWKTSGSGNQNWSTNSGGTSVTDYWTNDAIAVFSAGSTATGSFTITVAGGPDVASIIVQEGNITFAGSNLTLSGATPSINVATGLTATFNSQLKGPNGLVKAGAGTLVVTNTGNSYSGDTAVNGGKLQIGSGNNILPTSTTVTVAGGATLELLPGGSTQTVASLAGSGAVNISDNTLKSGDASDTIFSGALSGSGTFLKQGSGTLTLSGNNGGFDGTFDINAGTVEATNSTALGTAVSGNDIANNAALHFSGNVNVTETDVTIRGDGADGTGVLRSLSGSNAFNTGLILGANSTIRTDSGSTFTLSGDVNVGGRTLTADGAGATVYGGSISGSGKLVKDGSGTVTLSGTSANTYSGTTVVNDGTLQLGKTARASATGSGAITVGDGAGTAGSAVLRLLEDDQIDDASDVTLNTDGVLRLNNLSETIGKLLGSGAVDTGASGQLTVVTDSNFTFSGSLEGTGTVTKAGTGVLTLASSFNFAGTLNLDGGSLKLSDISLGIGTLNITSNSTIDFSGASTLSLTNLNIASGVTLNVLNWANAADYFFVQNWSGALFDTRGMSPMDQIAISGFGSSSTMWQSYDKQVTPVPESRAVGVWIIGMGVAVILVARCRRRSETA